MSLFNTFTLTYKRAGFAGSYVNGRWVESLTSSDTFDCSWQPATSRDLQILPEGKRQKVIFKGYTSTKLIAADPETGIQGDIIIGPDCNEYEIIFVGDWQNNIISHYKFMAMRVKEGT